MSISRAPAPTSHPKARWWWLDAASPEEEAAYWEEQRLTAYGTWRSIIIGALVMNILWWPTDSFMYHGDPGVLGPVAAARLGSLALCLVAFPLLSWIGVLQRNGTLVLVALVVLDCLVRGYEFGRIGGPSSPWFPLMFPFVLAPTAISVRPPQRVLLPICIAIACAAGFFGFHPRHLHDPSARLLLSYLAFMILMSIAAGLVTDFWRRRAFFLQQATDRQAHQLAELNHTLESRVEAQTAELRSLTVHLESAREAERAHIAMELHDELGQELTALRYALKFMRLRYDKDPGAISPHIEDLETTLARVTRTTRNMVHGLRPTALDDLGLIAAAEQLVKSHGERTRIACILNAPTEDPMLATDTATAAFRILQEALTNTARHANASVVKVSIRVAGDTLHLEVRDDGTGLSPARGQPAGMGLVGMRERARSCGGQLEVESVPGQGTVIVATLPVRRETVPA